MNLQGNKVIDMKKFFIKFMAVIVLAGSTGLSQTAVAASQDECAIWLCLPAGFPSGCGPAKSAMKHRLKKFKPPLPNIAACMVADEHTNPKDFTFTLKTMRKMAATTRCVKRNRWSDRCLEYRRIPQRYVPGTYCRYSTGSGQDKEWHTIKGCLGVYREIKIFEKNKLIGAPYYFQ